MDDKPKVGVVMGSQSDWDVMQHAARVLKDFGVAYEANVVSAHRTPDAMFEYAEKARGRGLACIIAGAGGAAHLPGIPVATFAIGEAGAANAGLFAVSLLAGADATLADKLAEYREKLREQVAAMQLPDVL